jgi:DNA-binding LacI/PurR family transcriptional regulator
MDMSPDTTSQTPRPGQEPSGGGPGSLQGARRAARQRPTINDVAAVAGVSRGTVSRALNGGRDVSPSALAAVNKAIRQTGYVVNRHARSLVTRRSHSVAFILSDTQEKFFEDPNFPTLLRGCTQGLAAHDIQLLLMIAGSQAERRRVSRYLTAGHVDGALLISAHAGDPVFDELRRSGIPAVACGKPLGHERDLAYVAADDRDGARQMVRHLSSRGRRRIATITGPLDMPGGVDRLAGYRDVLGPDGDPSLVAVGDYTQAGGEAAMDELLARAPDLDAVFVASDLMAAGALAALRRAGRRVPEDVAVGGFDDSSIAMTVQPPLTTIRNPLANMSAEMVRLLLALMAGGSPAAVIMPTQLVARDST